MLDWVTFAMTARIFGAGDEMNPIAKTVWEAHGAPGVLVIKLISVSVGSFFWWVLRRHPRTQKFGAAFVIGIQLLGAAMNTAYFFMYT